MLEKFGNMWLHQDDYDAVVVTTNGAVKKDGRAVMGKGTALEAATRYPFLSFRLGQNIAEWGSRVYAFDFLDVDYEWRHIITFPVKYLWREKADLRLIEKSTRQLLDASITLGLHSIVLPRPGCGNGGLNWEQVEPIISPILDDRFTVMEIN